MRLTLWLQKLYIYYRVRVDEKKKCPACGLRRKHKIAFSPAHRALIHQCGFCNACWAELPVVAAEQWNVGLQPEAIDETASIPFGAPREPLQAKARN